MMARNIPSGGRIGDDDEVELLVPQQLWRAPAEEAGRLPGASAWESEIRYRSRITAVFLGFGAQRVPLVVDHPGPREGRRPSRRSSKGAGG
jgi:hypothetical protein